jgi:uncharacterized phage protein gp47/JayE
MQLSDLVYIDSTGYHFADYPSFRQWLIESYQGIYGADVYLEDDSQDGQFLSILAKAFYDTAALGASVYNSFSPVSAQGTGLSRLVKINGLERQIPSYSTAQLTIVGVAGTVITNGVASDTLEQKWNLPTTVTIPDSGTIVVTGTAAVIGAITAESGTITTIFTPTRGWQSVNNVSAATPGTAVESDATLRARQQISVANPSLTVFDGTVGAVANVTGVSKVQGYENDTGSTDLNGVPAHSICVVVAGGDDTAVAQAIQVHKTPGTGTYGDTTVVVFDSQGMPLEIAFQRAVTATIHVQITISVNEGWSNDFIPLIQEAVAAVINAGGIGDTVLLTKLFAPAYLNGTAPGQTYDIATIELAKNGGGYSAANVTLNFDENPVCDPDTDVVLVIS